MATDKTWYFELPIKTETNKNKIHNASLLKNQVLTLFEYFEDEVFKMNDALNNQLQIKKTTRKAFH